MTNPHNFESYIDPAGGEWIRLKKGNVKNVVWRPGELDLTEDGQITFDVELFSGPGITDVTEENAEEFNRMVQAIMTEFLAYEQAALKQLNEELASAESVKTEPVVTSELSKHIDQQFIGGHQVSEALLPQDMQLDLQSISDALGGLKGA